MPPTGTALVRWANTTAGAKLVLPFVRTPINILKFAGERSVFGVALPEVRAALRAGGRQRDEALARITLGSGLSTAAVVAAMDGRVTGGGPTDPRERAALLQAGWRPYSVKVGDKWVSYQRFEPVSLLVGAAADFADVASYATEKERDGFAVNMAAAIAKNVTSKTWLSGLSDFFDMLSDPDRFAPSWFRRQAGSMAVPSLGNQVAQAMDPNLRDARTMLDAIKARVPVLSEDVPARRDIWGEPVERGDAIGPDLVSPFFTKDISGDPVRREIARLRVPLSMPPRYLRVDGQRVDLTPKQYDEFVQLAGQPARKYFEQVMALDEWQAMTDSERAALVKQDMKEFRSAARAALVDRYPELAGADVDDEPTPPPLPPAFQPGGIDPELRQTLGRYRKPNTVTGAGSAELPPLPPGFVVQ